MVDKMVATPAATTKGSMSALNMTGRGMFDAVPAAMSSTGISQRRHC
jgi:hypothetical protein